jgi:hypothetical protein
MRCFFALVMAYANAGSKLFGWKGLHALMTMIAYAFLQHRRLARRGGKKSTVHRLSRACRPYAKPSSISSFNHDLTDARTAEDKSEKSSCVNKSAKGHPFADGRHVPARCP